MPRSPNAYIFAEESGDLTFNNKGSRYFIVCTVTTRSMKAARRLLALRHKLTLAGQDIEKFHATSDPWPVRQRVFREIMAADIEVDAVVLDKRKTHPHIAADEWYFYQLAWHLLFKYIAPRRFDEGDRLLVAAASLGTGQRKARFKNAVDSVVLQHNVCKSVAVAAWEAATHPCLQVADYCAWAIQRWKESGDERPYDFIQPKILSCYEPFDSNPKTYY